MSFESLPKWNNKNPNTRKIGFEFELAGISLDEASTIILELFKGKLEHKHSLEAKITNTDLGNFKVELDADAIKSLASRLEGKPILNLDGSIDIGILQVKLSKWLGKTAGHLVPFEIITPPVTHDQLENIEKLRVALYKRNAKGTNASFTNAFGMHINTEVPSESVDDIRDILRAFIILYPWLVKEMGTDVSRRLLTYIDPFPKEYITLILDESYTSNIEEFIAAYLAYNPTRNRALDLLPLFSYYHPKLLEQLPEDSLKLIKARPTFHYRLPNCDINNPNWSIAKEWNYWVRIEKLACNKENLAKLSREYLSFLNTPLHNIVDDWSDYILEELHDVC